MTLDEIKQALQPCFSGNLFTGPDTLFGSATLKAVFDASLPNEQLVIDGTMSETSTDVVISGTGQGPFAGMQVTATFTPQGNDVALVVTGTSAGDGDWAFATAYPSLAGSVLANLGVLAGASLILRTITDNQHPAGLGFMGNVSVGGTLLQAAKFIGTVPSLAFAGPITMVSGAPSFTLVAPIAQPFTLGPLVSLALTANLDASKTPAVAIVTTVSVTVNGSATNLPAAIVFNGDPTLHLIVTAPSGSGVAISDLIPLALGGALDSLLPPVSQYDPTGAIALQTIDFAVVPATPALTGVTFSLGSTRPWTIGSQFAVTDVDMELIVATSGASVSGTIAGGLQIGPNGSVCMLEATAALPDGTFSAKLDPNGSKPNVSDLVTYLAGNFGLPTITVSSLDVELDPGKSTYSLTAGFSTDWSLDIGDFGLSIAGASIALADTAGTPSGTVTGTLLLDKTNSFAVTYGVPGGFKLVAQVPSISLSTLVGDLCKAIGTPPPSFDFSFVDSTILITEDGGNFTFQFGTQLDSYGSAALVVQNANGWAFAFGLLLDTTKLGALPGLGLLSAFDSIFGLEEIAVIFGTLSGSGFTFPALADFDNPNIKAPAISTPAWNGTLAPGLSIYAMLDPQNSEAFGWLCKLVDFSGQVAAEVTIPEDPTGTQLALTISGQINSNMTMSGAFIAKLVGGQPVLSLQGTIPTTIASQSVTFTIAVSFEANGVFVSGNTGAGDTISFCGIDLQNLAIELGVDAEGIPSIGVAGTIMVGTFDSSIAIFFNSATPSQSMFAGSISDVTLDEVLGPIVGLAAGSVPPEVTNLLKQFSLQGTQTVSVPASLSTALDARDATPVIAAFATAGITLDANPANISILGGASGAWAVTDLSTLFHYHLTPAGATITVEKEAQVKVVPQATQLGTLPPVQAGYALSGELSVFGLYGLLDVNFEPSVGLSVEANMSPIQLLNGSLLTITADGDTSKGPYLSLSSYTQGSVPPHATASGTVTLLGLVGNSIAIDISPSGGAFLLASTNPVYSYSINVTLNGSGFTATGSATLGFNQSVDLGVLGTLPLNVSVGGSVLVTLTGSAATASFSGNFTFEGQGFSTGQVGLDVTSASLENLANEIASAIAGAIKTYLLGNLDPSKWLNWVKNNIIPNVAQNAQMVGQVLGATFHQSADQIASAVNSVLGYGADAAATALNAANVTANAAADAMADAGYAAGDIANAIKNAFTNTHADTAVHIDTPGGPHADTTPHLDTPAGPHTDTQIPPHGDGNTHGDTSGPHGDVGKWGVHADTTPHIDLSPHGDTPSGPHADTATPPHVDTSQHADTQVPPHGDTSPHVDVTG
jgi:hypothetical protein